MNAEKFRRLALDAIREIHARGKSRDRRRRQRSLYQGADSRIHAFAARRIANCANDLSHFSARELFIRLQTLDPNAAQTIDRQNPATLDPRARDLPAHGQTGFEHTLSRLPARKRDGIFVFRDREELHDRINRRVEMMFADGVVEEVRELETIGATARQTLGLREIRN